MYSENVISIWSPLGTVERGVALKIVHPKIMLCI